MILKNRQLKQFLALLFLYSTINAKAADTTLAITRFSPHPVQVTGLPVFSMDLNGHWSFNPAPATGFEKSAGIDPSWKQILVPGEWTMQGFTVSKNTWAGYTRQLTIPADWQGKRLKLKFHAVYSECEVYVNGKKAGEHLGGFTPFELDITKLVTAGTSALLAVRIKNESVANGTSNASRYAVHPLGGISRKVQLVAIPEVNIGSFHAAIQFDKEYKNALLKTEVTLHNESKTTCTNAVLRISLTNGSGQTVFSENIAWGKKIPAGAADDKIIAFPVDAPVKWDPEHPRLYSLKLELTANGDTETVERRIGFRQIEVRDSRVFVNNMPIKLRGACHHEVTPRQGRTVTGNVWLQDVQLFREANLNYIRTSHYPPAEELVSACDSLGMFLEVEAPFCWAHETAVTAADSVNILQRQTLDMVNFFKSAPSVLMWSLGNESLKYKEYFSATAPLVKKLDPSRPRIFSQWGPDADNGELEITNHHYPGPGGPAQYTNSKRPIVFDEYVHINAYNRFELVTDPGIRDAWGIGFNAMWENMYKTPAVLGGAIWAGIDDSFFMPDSTAVGYGTWGIIDGWRRPKPEYWNTKKIYSPIKIKQLSNLAGDSICFEIENRHLFSNLSECRIEWRAGKHSGAIRAAAPAGKTWRGAAIVKSPLAAGEPIFIDVYDPRNILIDQYTFTAIPALNQFTGSVPAKEPLLNYQSKETTLSATGKDVTLILYKNTGVISITDAKNNTVIDALPHLMILPLNGEGRGVQMTGTSQVFEPFTATARNRVVQNIAYQTAAGICTITIRDAYDEAIGSTTLTFTGNGSIQLAYRYTLKQTINPRQWGLVFNLPDSYNKLSWKRNGIWNYYPGDQIGRLSGSAPALSDAPVSGAAGPVDKPSRDWSQDRNELGTNDFRATKMNILEAVLEASTGKVKVLSEGTQHIRTWKEKNRTKLLVADYSNLGSEGFFRSHASLLDRPLKKGDIIEGNVRLQIIL